MARVVYPNDLIGFPCVLYGKVKAWNGSYGYCYWSFNGKCFKQDMMFHWKHFNDTNAVDILNAGYKDYIISFKVGEGHVNGDSDWRNDKPTANSINILDHASMYTSDDLARMLMNKHESYAMWHDAPAPAESASVVSASVVSASVVSAIPPIKPVSNPTSKAVITGPSVSIWNGRGVSNKWGERVDEPGAYDAVGSESDSASAANENVNKSNLDDELTKSMEMIANGMQNICIMMKSMDDRMLKMEKEIKKMKLGQIEVMRKSFELAAKEMIMDSRDSNQAENSPDESA
jgi:hypothetical protein